MHRINRAEGEMIYEEGETSVSAFLVLSGRVSMTRSGVVSSAGKGAVIGFSGLFNRPYGSTAVADTDCALLVFSRKEIRALIRSNPVEADTIIDGIITVLGEVAAALEARADGASAAAAGRAPEAEAAGEARGDASSKS